MTGLRGTWTEDFWNWLNTCRSAECEHNTGSQIGTGIPPQYGSGETDVEGGGWFGGGPGDFGGETTAPIDPYTGKVIPYRSAQPMLLGVSMGTWILAGFALIVLKGALNFDGGRR